MQLTDQIGQVHTFEKTPVRIISLVPSLTETLCALDLEKELIGITKFCVHPFHLKSTKTLVGGTKKVHIEKIRMLKPDIIVANKEENTLEIVESLREIAPVWVTDITTIPDSIQMLQDFGELFGRRTEAQKWTFKLQRALAEFSLFVQKRPVLSCAYFIWKNPHMAVGKNTYINSILQLNHFDNIYANKEERYPEVEIKKLKLEGDPKLIFLSSEPYPFNDEDAFEIGRFTHHAKTVFVDGEMFSWYGVRLLRALSYFKQLHEKL